MAWSIQQVFDELVARVVHGPMQFRFLLQPTMAVCLGVRDATADFRAGAPPFLWGLFSHTIDRKSSATKLLRRLRGPVLIASTLDAIAQYAMFGHVRPLSAVLVGSTLMALPYCTARGLANRYRLQRRKAHPESGGPGEQRSHR